MQNSFSLRRLGLTRLMFAGCLALTAIVGFGWNGTAVYAQDDGADAAPAEQPAAPQATEPGTTDEAPQQETFLEWMIRASGIFGLILLLLSLAMVALILMNAMQVRRDNFVPPDFIEEFEQKLDAKDIQAAYEIAKNDDSFVARVLAAGLGKLSRGYNEAIEGMQEVGEEESMAIEHKLSYLALIGSVAPMIGLMGTVWGMILSFQVIANSAVAPKPADLADGIATALFTTLEGLGVAIPAIVFYSILKNRVARYVLEVGMVSEGLMSRFSTMGRTAQAAKPAGGASAATAPAQKADGQ